MRYDFTTVIDRTHAGSFKWDQMRGWNPDVDPGIIPFSVADMELLNPPEIIQGLQEYLDHLVLGYTGPTQAYFDAIIGWMKRRHGWDIQKEWLVQTAGVVSAFFNAVKVFTDPGDGVLFMTPAYYPFYSAIDQQGRVQVKVPLLLQGERYDIDWELFEESAKDPRNKILLFCSPHNPVGRIWLPEELERVVDICVRNDVVLVSDEIHFDLVMPGYKHTVISTISEKAAQHSIVLTAPSKTFNLAGAQCSNAVIKNDSLRQRFIAGLIATGFHMLNIFAYKACEIAYDWCEAWLEELLQLVHANHKLVKDYFATHMPAIKVYDLEGTYLQWMDFRALGLDKHQLEELMHKKAQVFMDEGYVFGPEGEGFERLNLAAPTHTIQAACERMHEAVKPYL